MPDQSQQNVETFRERERKFRVHGLWSMPDLAAVEGITTVRDVGTVTQTAAYYDTGDLRLAREGITLRRRSGGHDDGWHLKLPVGDGAEAAETQVRDELRLPLDEGDGPHEVPAELADLVTAYVRNGRLAIVTALRTRRTTWELVGLGDRMLAELVDDSVEVVDGDRVTLRFRELELEDREASGEELAPVITALLESGAVPGEFSSKAVRALGPLASAASDVPPPEPVSADDPAAKLVRAHLATYVRALRTCDVGVRRDQPDAVHQMRVAARRLRSGLRTFRPVLDRAWADSLREELAWIAGELGNARDHEVLTERLTAAADGLPSHIESKGARTLITQHLGDSLTEARDEAMASLRSERYVALLDLLVDAVHAPQTVQAANRSCAKVLPPLIAKAWKRLADDARALTLAGPDEAWHETRKAAKAVRYASEAVAPALGKEAKALAKQAERLTELLGEHQDAAVAAETLAELANGQSSRSGGSRRKIDGRTGFALGVLHAHQRQAVHDIRLSFPGTWAQVSHNGHRSFLRRGR